MKRQKPDADGPDARVHSDLSRSARTEAASASPAEPSRAAAAAPGNAASGRTVDAGAGIPPLADLVEITASGGEHCGCALVLHMRTPDGRWRDLSYRMLLTMLRFAEEAGVVPRLPTDWWSRTGAADGCALQGVEGE